MFSILSKMFPEPPVRRKYIVGRDGVTLAFAFRRIARTLARQHFLVMGKPGSGKTILVNLFLQSIADTLKTDSLLRSRAVVFDAKGDMLETLAGMGLSHESAKIYDLNPYRVGSMRWNIAEDVQTPSDARNLAKLLIPDEPNASAPFFALSAQNVLTAAIKALMSAAPRLWTLRDLLQSLVTLERFEALVSQFPAAYQEAKAHLDDKRHRDAILSTVHARLAGLNVLAALWDTTPKTQTFSLQRFLDEPGILILGHDERKEVVLEPLTVLLFHFLAQRLLSSSQAEVEHGSPPHTYFVLDEFRGLPDGGACASLLNRGRSKGVSILLGTQSYEGLLAKAEKNRQGANAVEELLGMCGAKAFLSLSIKSAEWAEKYFGTRRIWEESFGDSYSSNGSSSNFNYAMQERSLFTASSFTDNSDPSRSGRLRVHSDVDGQYMVSNRAFAEVAAKLSRPDLRFRGVERPVSDQNLRVWTAAEENYYCPRQASNQEALQKKEAPRLKPASRPDRPHEKS